MVLTIRLYAYVYLRMEGVCVHVYVCVYVCILNTFLSIYEEA